MKVITVKNIVVCVAVLVLGSIFGAKVMATTTTGALNVNLYIPATTTSGGGGGGGGSSPVDNPPVISNIVITPSTTSATAVWNATDDNGIVSVLFAYDTHPTNFANNNPVTPAYSTVLTSLASGQLYYYRITAFDTGGHSVSSTGTFTTISPADLTAPIISNVAVVATQTGATLTWDTNEAATSQVNYGSTSAYGSSSVDGSGIISHTQVLTGLVPSSTYHFQIIATDAALNSSATLDATFKTLADNVPPADVTNLQISHTASTIVLTWVNPADVDFTGVRIVRKINSPASTVNDGTQVFSGLTTTFTDSSVTVGVVYYYTIFSVDTSGNLSGGTYRHDLIPSPVTPEVCNNSVDDDGNGFTDCADSACAAYPACVVVTPPPTEICNNGIDDNANGAIDCADVACIASSFCTAGPGGGGSTTTPYTPPVITVPGFMRLAFSDALFFAGNRRIAITPNGTTVNGLAGISYSIIVPSNKLAVTTTSFILKIDGSEIHQFALSADGAQYAADFVFPAQGGHQMNIEVQYSNNEQDHLTGTLNSLPYGQVTGAGSAQVGATVELHSENGTLVDMSQYGMANPLQTGQGGWYGWVAPNGRYYLTVSANGFNNRQTPAFNLAGNIINGPLDLVPEFKLNDINLTNVVENTKILTQISLQKISDTAATAQEIKDDPQVQKTVSTFIAPTVVGAVAVGTVSLVSWANMLSLLQFLFVQPLLLIGRRKLLGYGQIYNALNKLPIDLATVRLLNAETNQLVQSKVTDSKGRYAFMVGPGKYKLQVFKNNFTFPSLNLMGIKDDGQKTSIYHGEELAISDEDAIVAVNIPLDPLGSKEKPVKIFWHQFSRQLKIITSWTGLIITALSLYIAPRWYMWVLLGIHVLFFVAFYRLSIPAKIKSWGVVLDKMSKAPIGRVVARLFNAQFNKVVATQITDGRGRYYFLAGDNEYFVTYNHPEYEVEKTSVINLRGKDAENIAVDIALRKKTNDQNNDTKPSENVV